MKFSKYLLFLVIAAIAVVVAACGNGTDSKVEEDNGTPST